MIIMQFVGLLWLLVEYFSTSFRAIYILLIYILKAVSFLLENEYDRFRLLKHSLVRNSHQNYSNIVYFRTYKRISVSIGINAKYR